MKKLLTAVSFAALAFASGARATEVPAVMQDLSEAALAGMCSALTYNLAFGAIAHKAPSTEVLEILRAEDVWMTFAKSETGAVDLLAAKRYIGNVIAMDEHTRIQEGVFCLQQADDVWSVISYQTKRIITKHAKDNYRDLVKGAGK